MVRCIAWDTTERTEDRHMSERCKQDALHMANWRVGVCCRHYAAGYPDYVCNHAAPAAAADAPDSPASGPPSGRA